MDHLTGLDIDGDLVPDVYVAAAAWARGDRQSGMEVLERSLSNHLGGPALGAWDTLLESTVHDNFRGALQWIAANPARLHVEPARVAAVLWRQAPTQTMLNAIVLGDLRWSDDPFDYAPRQTPGAEILARLLRDHLAAGHVSRGPGELPDGGRPLLDGDLLAVMEAPRLGRVAEALLQAPAGTADLWWERSPEIAPAVVLRAFVHDAFLNTGLGGPANVWSWMRTRLPGGARALLRSFERLAEAVPGERWAVAGDVLTRGQVTDLRATLRRLFAGNAAPTRP